MVIDTSAVVAILRFEPEARAFIQAIADAEASCMSAVSVLEAALVLTGGQAGIEAWRPLDAFIERAGIEIVPFDRESSRFAREAFLRFGKGRHPARLNFGDRATYALAASCKLPVLFKGEDFPKTDISPAL